MPFAPDARGDSFKELILTFYSPKRILQSMRSINDYLGLKPTASIVTIATRQ